LHLGDYPVKVLQGLILLFSVCGSLNATASPLDTANLSSRTVTSVTLDHRGAVWVGTDEGLNFYTNGNTYQFYADITDPKSLLDSDVSNVISTPDRSVVALTASGLSFYNELSFDFTQVPLDSLPTGLFLDPVTDQYWVATEKSGIAVVSKVKEKLTSFRTDPLNPLSISTSDFEGINRGSLDFSSDKKVYIATRNGFNVFDRSLKTFKRYFQRAGSLLTSSNIKALRRLDSDSLLVITDLGVNVYDTLAGEFEEDYVLFENPAVSVSHIEGERFLVQTSQDIRLATVTHSGRSIRLTEESLSSGLADGAFVENDEIFISSGPKLKVFSTNAEYKATYDLPATITSVKKVRSGLIVGTLDGLNTISTSDKVVKSKANSSLFFVHMGASMQIRVYADRIDLAQNSSGQLQTIKLSESIKVGPSSIFTTTENILAINNGNALTLIDLETASILSPNIKIGIEDTPVSNLKGIDNFIFVSTGNGIQRFQLPITPDKARYKTQFIESMVSFEYNALLNNKIPRSFFDIEKIDGEYWITSPDLGLSVHSENLDIQFRNYSYREGDNKTLASKAVDKILYDKDRKIIYVSTRGDGLFRYNVESEYFENISMSDGLLSNNIYDLLLDSEKNIWLLTGEGINYISENSIRNINYEDGLVATGYLKSALHQLGEEIYVAGSGVDQYFFLDSINTPSKPGSVHLVKIVGLDSVNKKYSLALSVDSKLEIPHQITALKIDLFSDQPYKSDLTSFQYTRSGSDVKINNGNNQTIEISSLPYYETSLAFFTVNANRVLSSNPLSIVVIRNPPWWLTYQALIGYLLISILGVGMLIKYREGRQKQLLENERKSQELEEARALQTSLLPKIIPTREDMEISAYLRSANEVGGDYYDFYVMPEGLYAICGDATGHGVISGIMVSVTKAGLNGIQLTSPGEILRQLNLIVKRVNFGRLRMSLNIAKVGSSSVELSSAAMPPIFLYSAENSETSEILDANLPLGGLSRETYNTTTYPFGSNDVLVMVSDGLPELPNEFGEMLDYPRIFEAVNNNADGSADEIKEALVSLANNWTSADSIPDDITIVVLKRK
jgi:hypothetical protein